MLDYEEIDKLDNKKMTREEIEQALKILNRLAWERERDAFCIDHMYEAAKRYEGMQDKVKEVRCFLKDITDKELEEVKIYCDIY